MYFARSILTFLAVSSSIVAPVLAVRRPTPTRTESLKPLKQFNPLAALEEKRGLLDICVSADIDLAAKLGVALPILGPILGPIEGSADLCLCVGLLPTFIQSNIVLKLAAEIAGQDVLLNALVQIILGLSGQQQCSYPPHSAQLCTAGKPCDFTCKDGYVKQGNQCVCPVPKHECNGYCQSSACSAPTARWAHERALADKLQSRHHAGAARLLSSA